MKSPEAHNIKREETFNSCKNIASIVLILLAFGCSGTFIALWIVRSASGFNSVPYVMSSCSQSYFIVKYLNSLLATTIFITASVAAGSQGILLIVYILMQIKKQHISLVLRCTIGILSSLTMMTLVVPSGYSLSFFVQFSQAITYSCLFTYSNETVLIFAGLSIGSLIFTFTTIIILLTRGQSEGNNKIINEGLDIREHSQLQLLGYNGQNPNNQSENIFAPDIYMAQKLPEKYDKVQRKRPIRLQQSSRIQSQSYVQMKSPKSTSKNLQSIDVQRKQNSVSRTKDRVNSSVSPAKDKIKEDIWSQNSHVEELPLQAVKIKSKMFFRDIGRDWDDRQFQLPQRNIEEKRYFVPQQMFSYSKSSKTPMARSAVHKERLEVFPFEREQLDQVYEIGRSKIYERDKSRAIGQIRKNYERRLNSQQNWH